MSATVKLPITELVIVKKNRAEGYTNVRELAASIKRIGLIHPVLVRPLPDPELVGKYEVIAGARLVLAVTSLGNHTIECTVVEKSDPDTAEIRAAENLQREPLHPLDEAKTYDELILLGADIADVSSRFGVSRSRVYKILKLTKLTPDAAELYRAGVLSLGSAVKIAAVDEAFQERIILALLREHRSAVRARKELSSTDVDSVIRNTGRYLKRAAFDVAGCARCQSRTDYTNALFEELADDDLCFDCDCYRARQERALEQKRIKAPVFAETSRKDLAAGESPEGAEPDAAAERGGKEKAESAEAEASAIVRRACEIFRSEHLARLDRALKKVSKVGDMYGVLASVQDSVQALWRQAVKKATEEEEKR